MAQFEIREGEADSDYKLRVTETIALKELSAKMLDLVV